MSLFLRAKHWHLFLVLVGFPCVMSFTLVPFGMISASYETLTGWMTAIWATMLFGWLYAMGSGLIERLPHGVSVNRMTFVLSLVIPEIYLIVICLFVFPAANLTLQLEGGILAALMLVHLLSMICIFYSLVVVARLLKSVELGKSVDFSDYAGEFFLLWFFPLGVWIIQPRINRLFAREVP